MQKYFGQELHIKLMLWCTKLSTELLNRRNEMIAWWLRMSLVISLSRAGFEASQVTVWSTGVWWEFGVCRSVTFKVPHMWRGPKYFLLRAYRRLTRGLELFFFLSSIFFAVVYFYESRSIFIPLRRLPISPNSIMVITSACLLIP